MSRRVTPGQSPRCGLLACAHQLEDLARHANAQPPLASGVGMLALIQRVSEASVRVGGECVGTIGPGMLALVAVEPADTPASVAKMASKLLDYRVFADDDDKMNLSLRATGGGLLLVSQFTLAADTGSGLRPSFASAAPPALAEPLFEALVSACRAAHTGPVASGRFRAHMHVALVNDGPVTFLLRV